MDRRPTDDVAIIGAGLIGCVLAVHLAKAGFSVQVFEREPDPRRSPDRPGHSVTGRSSAGRSLTGRSLTGRSLMIVLNKRGFRSLDAVGIGEKVREHCVPIYGRMIHATDGTSTHQPYGHNGEALEAIERSALNAILLDFAAKTPNVRVHFDAKCVDIDVTTAALTLVDPVTHETRRIQPSRVFGADGAYSCVRQALQKQKLFNYKQQYLSHVYKEILIPAAPDGRCLLDTNVFHVWPRQRLMLSGFPSKNGDVGLILQMPHNEGEPCLANLRTKRDLASLFEQYFPDVLELAEPDLGSFFAKPLGTFLTIKCEPWRHGDKIALIGDACHAMLPFLGQGANSGFEDCRVLIECLQEHPDDWEAALGAYETRRRPDTDAIADLSYEHFLVLQTDVADPAFQLRRKIERKVQSRYARQISSSQYYNIAFTEIPYRETIEIERRFRQKIDEIFQVERIETLLETAEGDSLLDRTFAEFFSATHA